MLPVLPPCWGHKAHQHQLSPHHHCLPRPERQIQEYGPPRQNLLNNETQVPTALEAQGILMPRKERAVPHLSNQLAARAKHSPPSLGRNKGQKHSALVPASFADANTEARNILL